LDHVSKLAEYANPKYARIEHTGADGEAIKVQLEGDALTAALKEKAAKLGIKID
jgi:hypothetical protein